MGHYRNSIGCGLLIVRLGGLICRSSWTSSRGTNTAVSDVNSPLNFYRTSLTLSRCFYLWRKTMRVERDNHHMLFSRSDWNSRPEATRLRTFHSLIANIPRGLHEEIHAECPPVPLLGYYALMNTYRAFEPEDTPLAALDSLIFAIDHSSDHPRAHELERQLAHVAAQTLALQRPFIKQTTRRTL